MAEFLAFQGATPRRTAVAYGAAYFMMTSLDDISYYLYLPSFILLSLHYLPSATALICQLYADDFANKNISTRHFRPLRAYRPGWPRR